MDEWFANVIRIVVNINDPVRSPPPKLGRFGKGPEKVGDHLERLQTPFRALLDGMISTCRGEFSSTFAGIELGSRLRFPNRLIAALSSVFTVEVLAFFIQPNWCLVRICLRCLVE